MVSSTVKLTIVSRVGKEMGIRFGVHANAVSLLLIGSGSGRFGTWGLDCENPSQVIVTDLARLTMSTA